MGEGKGYRQEREASGIGTQGNRGRTDVSGVMQMKEGCMREEEKGRLGNRE